MIPSDMDGQAPEHMDWDPFAPDFMAVHAELRARCPVAHSAKLGGFWGITRYADIVAAARDTSTFISSKGMTIPQLGNMVQQVPIELDPPLHSVYRRVLQPYFLPDYLVRLEPDIRSLTNELLEPLISSGSGDLVEHLSFPLPARVLCLWMNLPASTWLRLKGFAEETIRTRTTGDKEGNRVVENAINAFIRELFGERRATPRDPATDLLSGLLAARAKRTGALDPRCSLRPSQARGEGRAQGALAPRYVGVGTWRFALAVTHRARGVNLESPIPGGSHE